MTSNLDAILAQYEKNTASSNTQSMTSEERLKKYFTTILPKNTRTAEKRIRILPTLDGSSPFVEKNFHEIQVDGKWVKLYDPAQDGQQSPLNEVRNALYESGVEADKQLAKQYYARPFFMVKVIDRENEQDGVKFWRFKSTKKRDGIFDKIFAVLKSRGDILDPEKGRDLLLTLSLEKANNGKEYTTITSILPDDPSPLSVDKDLANQWLNDTTTWEDVYSKKPLEYLEIVARGEVPFWNKETKKWVSKESAEETIAGGVSVAVEDGQEYEEVDGDLPF